MTLDRRTSQTESAGLTRFAVERYPSAKRACAEVEHWDDLRTERYVEGRTVIGTTLFVVLANRKLAGPHELSADGSDELVSSCASVTGTEDGSASRRVTQA